MAFKEKAQLQLDEKMPWGRQIFLFEIDQLASFLKDSKELNDTERIELFVKKDIRKSLFFLEYLSRVYEDHDSVFFGKLRASFKEVEDLLGRLTLLRGLSELATSLKEPQLKKYFDQSLGTATKDLTSKIKQLESSEGLAQNGPQNTLQQIRNEVSDFKGWESLKDEKDFLIEVVVDDLKSLHKEISRGEYDQKDIEKGFHKLRRKLRGFLVVFGVLKNLIVYKKTSDLPEDILKWAEKLKEKKYPQLDMTGKTLISRPIVLPKELTDMMGDLVTEIGLSKDVAEKALYTHEAMEKLLVSKDPDLKISEKDQDRILGKLESMGITEEVNHQELAQKYQKRLDKTNLLKIFAQWIKYLNE